MMLKDLRLAQQAAGIADAATPLGAHAEAIYAQLDEDGYAGLDFSGIMRRLKGEI